MSGPNSKRTDVTSTLRLCRVVASLNYMKGSVRQNVMFLSGAVRPSGCARSYRLVLDAGRTVES